MSTDHTGRGSEYVGTMMKPIKAVIVQVLGVGMIEVDMLRYGYILDKFQTGLLTIKRYVRKVKNGFNVFCI